MRIVSVGSVLLNKKYQKNSSNQVSAPSQSFGSRVSKTPVDRIIGYIDKLSSYIQKLDDVLLPKEVDLLLTRVSETLRKDLVAIRLNDAIKTDDVNTITLYMNSNEHYFVRAHASRVFAQWALKNNQNPLILEFISKEIAEGASHACVFCEAIGTLGNTSHARHMLEEMNKAKIEPPLAAAAIIEQAHRAKDVELFSDLLKSGLANGFNFSSSIAAYHLGNLGTKEHLSLLEEAAKSSVKDVSLTAKRAIEKINQKIAASAN